ncbi:MAG TPA: sigma-70 family RNA polymerase sigma factor [Pyrinomonadaceae bacterium]|nr:sigma-70 family RNA polymerase sigma factor [Pyrinomonadaceae bacterium]
MSQSKEQNQKLYSQGAARLVARATEHYGVARAVLEPRIKAAVEKYILKYDENAQTKTLNDFIDSLQADDLCLIVACEQGNQKAWGDLVERFSVTVRSAARAASFNEDGAEDLAQSIWAELHGLRIREDGKPAGKLAYYSGRGSLAGWLRAVVAQLAVDQHRKSSRLVQTEEDADFDRILSQRHDENSWTAHGVVASPEVEVSRKFAAADMQKALADSIGKLSAEDRLLVKLYYFDGLRLKEAGAVLGVHEATASRRLTRIHGDLRSEVEKTLTEERGWTRTDTEDAFSSFALHLEADIEPLVTSEGVLMNKERGSPLKSS